MKDLSLKALGGIAVGVVLGTVFSFLYPSVEIDASLALLFGFIGYLVVVGASALWRVARGSKT